MLSIECNEITLDANDSSLDDAIIGGSSSVDVTPLIRNKYRQIPIYLSDHLCHEDMFSNSSFESQRSYDRVVCKLRR